MRANKEALLQFLPAEKDLLPTVEGQTTTKFVPQTNKWPYFSLVSALLHVTSLCLIVFLLTKESQPAARPVSIPLHEVIQFNNKTNTLTFVADIVEILPSTTPTNRRQLSSSSSSYNCRGSMKCSRTDIDEVLHGEHCTPCKDGKDGAAGKDGAVGAVGATGQAGAAGAAGAAGKDGLDGAAGKDGLDGAAGAAGAAGQDGLDGAAGAAGAAGQDGLDGAAGAVGAAGQDGAAGAVGAAGKDGQDGLDGAAGAAGAAGQDGLDGAAGKDGQDGTDVARTYLTMKNNQLEINVAQVKILGSLDVHQNMHVHGDWHFDGDEVDIVH